MLSLLSSEKRRQVVHLIDAAQQHDVQHDAISRFAFGGHHRFISKFISCEIYYYAAYGYLNVVGIESFLWYNKHFLV